MSEISSIAGAAGISLYHKAGDETSVFLEAKTVSKSAAGTTEVTTTIQIPSPIWEYLRQYAAVDLSLASLSDKQLLALVEKQVDKRIANRNNPWIHGNDVFGEPSNPRQKQIRRGLKLYRVFRSEQRKIVAVVKSMQWGEGWPTPKQIMLE